MRRRKICSASGSHLGASLTTRHPTPAGKDYRSPASRGAGRAGRVIVMEIPMQRPIVSAGGKRSIIVICECQSQSASLRIVRSRSEVSPTSLNTLQYRENGLDFPCKGSVTVLVLTRGIRPNRDPAPPASSPLRGFGGDGGDCRLNRMEDSVKLTDTQLVLLSAASATHCRRDTRRSLRPRGTSASAPWIAPCFEALLERVSNAHGDGCGARRIHNMHIVSNAPRCTMKRRATV
jgi:hypothetical protein